MTRFGWMVATAIALICACIVGVFVWTHKTSPAPVAGVATSTTPVIDPSALAIYSSGEYGFTFFYPAGATLEDAFTGTSSSNLPWRAQAVASGTLVVQVAAPEGKMRVGISSAQKETAVCTQPGPAEKPLSSVSIASTTWSKFSFDKLGTDDEEHVTSYRTLHDHACYALETFEPFTATASTTAFGLVQVVNSFTFANN